MTLVVLVALTMNMADIIDHPPLGFGFHDDEVRALAMLQELMDHGVPTSVQRRQEDPRVWLAERTVVAVRNLGPYTHALRHHYRSLRRNPPLRSSFDWYDDINYFDMHLLNDPWHLVKQFSPELTMLGLDPAILLTEPDKYKPLVDETSAIMGEMYRTEELPDTPEHHWVYEVVEGMKKMGLLVGYKDRLYRGPTPPYTGTDIAEYTIEAVSRLESILKEREQDCKWQIENPRSRDDLSSVRRFMDYYESEIPGVVTSVSREFAPELKALGASKDGLAKKVIDCRPLAVRVEKLYEQAKRP